MNDYLEFLIKLVPPLGLALLGCYAFLKGRLEKYLDNNLSKKLEKYKQDYKLLSTVKSNILETCREIAKLAPRNRDNIVDSPKKSELQHLLRDVNLLEERIRDLRIFIETDPEKFETLHAWKEDVKEFISNLSSGQDNAHVKARILNNYPIFLATLKDISDRNLGKS